MKLLILIVVMVLERFWTTLDDMRADRAIENQVLSLRDRLSKVVGAPLALGLIWILFPLLVAWFMSSLGSSLFGLLIYLLISIAVLLLLLAPRQMNQQVKALHEACSEEDEEGAAQCRAKLAEGTAMDPETATTQQLAERIIALGFHEWFAVLFWFAFGWTRWGRYVYAIGGNRYAANLTGVPVRRIICSVYVLCGLMAGVAAILEVGWLGAVTTGLGTGDELRVIAATVVGGTNLAGGVGSAFGTVVGAALIEVIRNSLILLGVDAFWQGTVVGTFIVVAVLFNRLGGARQGD